MVLLPGIENADQARTIASRILSRIMQAHMLGQHEVMVTPSIGVVLYPTDGEDIESLMRSADLAMYFAKRQCPGTIAFFHPDMNTGALRRLAVESQLRGAIARDELSLHFQPQFDLATGHVCAMEALLSWSNPELGSVPYAEFIPVAEDTGLILQIGEWVLRSACAQARVWREEGLPVLRISVNISGMQLSHRGFPTLISSILQAADMSPDFLELEVTESVVMQNEAWMLQVLQELKSIGVQITIDHFGTGYSSLGRLRAFPIDRLKIDKSFISRLHGTGEDRALAGAIIAMAKTLEVDVVAEGIEEFPQLLMLQEDKCQQAQGFLLSPPLSAEDSFEFLRRLEIEFDGSRTERLRHLLG
jgi:EAL domain-containing protein (putative c-di-GMP-specific phosphodiesterase class I)